MAMAIRAPDGTLLESLGEEVEEDRIPLDTPEGKDGGDCGMSSPLCGGRGASVGMCRCGGIGGYAPDPPGPYNVIDQLVVALHDAGLNTNPKHR